MIIFGGNSPEHEVSLRSAAAIYRNIDRRLFHPIPVGMTRDGRFYRVVPPADGAGQDPAGDVQRGSGGL